MFNLFKLIQKEQELQLALANADSSNLKDDVRFLCGCGEACSGTCSGSCDDTCEGYCSGCGSVVD